MRVINTATNTIVNTFDTVDRSLTVVNKCVETAEELASIAVIEARKARLIHELEAQDEIAQLEAQLAAKRA